MQTKKMSLANIKGKLSRAEMKNIMAGSGNLSCNLQACGGCYANCKCDSAGKACIDK